MPKSLLPAEALLVEAGDFGFAGDVRRGGGAVRFAERVAADDEGDGFFVVHGHAAEGFADVVRGLDGIGIAVWAFGVHVDEAHLHGGERVFENTRVDVAIGFVVGDEDRVIFAFDDAFGAVLVADIATEPGNFGAPVDVVIWFPNVGASAAEAEGFEAHRFERDVAGEDHEVGPRNLAAVFLLDGPEEAAGFVEADVIGPAVERGEALLTATAAAAAIAGAVGAGGVPGHADEERAVVAEVGGPPGLRIGHEGREVFFERGEVEAFEFFGVVEVFAHGVGLRGMLAEEIDAELVRPPIAVGGAAAGDVFEGVLCNCGSCHGFVPRRSL